VFIAELPKNREPAPCRLRLTASWGTIRHQAINLVENGELT